MLQFLLPAALSAAYGLAQGGKKDPSTQGMEFMNDRLEKMLSGELYPGYNYYDFSMRDKVPSLGSLQALLSGNQSRAAGQAGAGAAGQAMSMGMANPFASAQRASNNVYQGYANQFANLPQQQFQMQGDANQFDWNRLMQIFGAQTGNFGNMSPTFGDNLARSLTVGTMSSLLQGLGNSMGK